MTSQIISVAIALFSSGLLWAGTTGIERMAQDAELIAAVRILSIDDTAMPADGPMYVEARVLKLVKGRNRPATGRLRFGASAWVGPSYRRGEERIVLLAAVPAGHAYYDRARWSSAEAGKLDLFLAREDLKDLSAASLLEFLRLIEACRTVTPTGRSGPCAKHCLHRSPIDQPSERNRSHSVAQSVEDDDQRRGRSSAV